MTTKEPRPKNLKAFYALIKRYRGITLSEINSEKKKLIQLRKKNGYYGHLYYQLAEKLTGFGSNDTCTLCKPTICLNSVYAVGYTDYDNRRTLFCVGVKEHRKTYNKIQNANTSEQLLSAFKARANYMDQWLKKNDLLPKKKLKKQQNETRKERTLCSSD
jgi:hypothetical protein